VYEDDSFLGYSAVWSRWRRQRRIPEGCHLDTVCFLWGVSRSEREADFLLPSNAEIKNAWRVTSTSPPPSPHCLHGASFRNRCIILCTFIYSSSQIHQPSIQFGLTFVHSNRVATLYVLFPIIRLPDWSLHFVSSVYPADFPASALNWALTALYKFCLTQRIFQASHIIRRCTV
jgi:hypothetical protein